MAKSLQVAAEDDSEGLLLAPLGCTGLLEFAHTFSDDKGPKIPLDKAKKWTTMRL
jgi:hypothetical protein